MRNTAAIQIVRKHICTTFAVALLAAAPGPVAFTPFAIPAGSHLQDPTFTPDGKTLFLTQGNADGTYSIVTSTQESNAWTSPSIVPFSGHWRDLEEILSPDGQTMVFASNRPAETGGQTSRNVRRQTTPELAATYGAFDAPQTVGRHPSGCRIRSTRTATCSAPLSLPTERSTT